MKKRTRKNIFLNKPLLKKMSPEKPLKSLKNFYCRHEPEILWVTGIFMPNILIVIAAFESACQN
jgi:hypothetical protein